MPLCVWRGGGGDFKLAFKNMLQSWFAVAVSVATLLCVVEF